MTDRGIRGSELDKIGERATWQKRALASALAGSDTFRSAQDIHAELRSQGDRIGLTTVYNQLRAMSSAGSIDMLRAEDGETLYRRCSSDGHHHHLLCRYCGKTIEIDAPDIEAWATKTARARRFTDVTHTVEIVGTCQSCNRKRHSAST
jgi:Fur family ferric uptake transcriptional regulator